MPTGSGLSSSAALEVATAYALLNGRPLDKLEIAKLCQRAERSGLLVVSQTLLDHEVHVFAMGCIQQLSEAIGKCGVRRDRDGNFEGNAVE